MTRCRHERICRIILDYGKNTIGGLIVVIARPEEYGEKDVCIEECIYATEECIYGGEGKEGLVLSSESTRTLSFLYPLQPHIPESYLDHY